MAKVTIGLSKAERAFVEGRLTPKRDYRYLLVHRIRKKKEKLQQQLETINAELKLIDSFLEAQKRKD